jgi:hypothetical protein
VYDDGVNCLKVAALSLFSLTAAASLAARDYYVQPSDAAGDTKSGQASLRTLSALKQRTLGPGDRILLTGGEVFEGTLVLGAGAQGSAEAPIVVTSAGSGRAVIAAGVGNAILLDGAGHVSISNLVVNGSGRLNGNTGSGILIRNSRDITVENVEASGFLKSGIQMDGVARVHLTRIHSHDNGFAGISSSGAMSQDIYVGHSLAENNPGDPTIRDNHSGNGIVIGRVRNATIEHCEARNNGWDMPWTGNGPVGIWTYQADNVTIQHNISHHNRSTAKDGGGFDLDGGVTNSVVQYNYSHNNFGSGYLICQYANAGRFANNVVRYNISFDDGLFDHGAGIFLWVGGREMIGTVVHNNTVVNTKGAAVTFAVGRGYEDVKPQFDFFNNIFVSLGPQIQGGSEKGRFVGNLYWSVGERGFRVDDYRSLESWAKDTGQETKDGKSVGRYADPVIERYGNVLLSRPEDLPAMTEFRLMPGSPAIDNALDLPAYAIKPGKRDLSGNRLPQGPSADIGALERVP